LEELTASVEENVLPTLEGVTGLSDAQVSGQRVQKVTMSFDQEALAQYGLTEETIQQLIQGSNLTFPLGLTNFDGELKNLVIDGDITSVDDLRNLQIPAIPAAAAEAPSETPAVPGSEEAGTEVPSVQSPATEASAATPTAIPTVALSELADIEVVS